MKNYLRLTLALFSLLFITSCGEKKENSESTKGSINLNYKFKQGQEFLVLLEWHETVDGKDSLGKGKKDTITMATTFKYVVDRVDDKGTADLSVTYYHLKMNNFDSDDTSKQNTREGMMYAGMKNYVLKTKITNKGKVLELTGGDNFYTFGQPDSLVDDNDCLKKDLSQFFSILPEGEIKNGGTWEDSHTINFGYPGIFKNKYKFVGIEDSVATIEISSVITPNTNGMTVFPGGFVLHQLFNGSRTSVIKFDMKKGIIASSSYHDLYNGNATGIAQGNRILINLNVDLHKNFSLTNKL